MNMKKRSQSSLRAKTLQSESDPAQQNYWIGNLHNPNVNHSQHQHQKLRVKQNFIASSMIQYDNNNNNKQNTESSNIPVYKSVQELSDRSEVVHRTPTSYKNSKGKDYPIDITPNSNYNTNPKNSYIKIQNHDEQTLNPNNPKQVGHFNYMQQYYESQIDSMGKKIQEMSIELKRYRELYSSKQNQLDDLSDGLSSRICKENNEKNVLIKEINSNNIEIKRLKQEINLHRSEKQALKIVLKQKETVIEELNSSIVQVQMKKRKVEGYEIQLRESQSSLKEIQLQMNKLRAEAEKKDTIISNSNKKISVLESKLVQYQDEIKQLERCTISLKENTCSSKQKIEASEKQCQEWKHKYCEVKVQLEQIPELQTKVKNSQSALQEMQIKMKEMFVTNEKLRVDLVNYQSMRNRNMEQEKELSSLKKLLRDKCEEFEVIENSNKLSAKMEEELEYYRGKLTASEKEIQEKDQQHRMLRLKLEEKQHKINNLYQELQQISRQSVRIKQLQNKVDTLFNQNQKLHTCLLQKISQIEDLQRRLNIQQSKNTSLNNEHIKIKAMYQSANQELSECESRFENMKNRWESQMGAKMGLEEKCNRMSKEIVGLRAQVVCLEESNRKLSEKSEEIVSEFEEKKLELYLQLDELNNYKIQAETQLQTSQKKTQQLRLSLSQLKSQIGQHIDKQNTHILRIRDLELQTIRLQEELYLSRQESEKQRRFWAQVQEIAGVAVSQLR